MNAILHGLYRGRSIPVLAELEPSGWRIVDVNGSDPSTYPQSVAHSALAKMQPKPTMPSMVMDLHVDHQGIVSRGLAA